ncbi:MAG TPA: PepSY-associated TM helix domain-containing protein [Gemmatimonadaceae bacterium]
MHPRSWRQWHRWVAFPAALFLIFAGTTGVLVAATEFWGEDEALREATRDLVSPVTVASPAAAWSDPIAKALAGAATIAPNAPIDKIQTQFKGSTPTITVFTGKPTGGEDRKLVFNANTGALVSNESYADKPFLYRLHSGEAFGDGGLVVAMFWGVALVFLGTTGLVIYWTMRGHRELTGIKRVFW